MARKMTEEEIAIAVLSGYVCCCYTCDRVLACTEGAKDILDAIGKAKNLVCDEWKEIPNEYNWSGYVLDSWRRQGIING